MMVGSFLPHLNSTPLVLHFIFQCPEAEFYIATSFPGIKRIVLIGDPMQLNATVLNTHIKELGYGNSFMTNAIGCRQQMAHLLSVQYRCDPAIMRFSNQNFYDNAVLTSRVVYTRKPRLAHPLLFINTGSGKENTKHMISYGKEERDGSSWKSKCHHHSHRSCHR
jgi:superfamily I DNA and/or RNA helicase